VSHWSQVLHLSHMSHLSHVASVNSTRASISQQPQEIFSNVSEDVLIPLGCWAEFMCQYATIYDPSDDLRYPQSIKSLFVSTEKSATQKSVKRPLHGGVDSASQRARKY
jgi:hypothetical protein